VIDGCDERVDLYAEIVGPATRFSFAGISRRRTGNRGARSKRGSLLRFTSQCIEIHPSREKYVVGLDGTIEDGQHDIVQGRGG
jgi:hypothetical protein